MGAKIQEVVYEEIPAIAKKMRTAGEELKKEVSSAYDEIDKLRNVWYGTRYNELIKGFNSIIPDIDKILELVIDTFPWTLETVANNYSKADKGVNATTAVHTNAGKIPEIQLNTKEGMKYLDAEVGTAKTNITNRFKNAEKKMNEIWTIYTKITWKSEASAAFEKTFKDLKNKIVKEFQEIDKAFTTQMNATAQDINSAESSNTVK